MQPKHDESASVRSSPGELREALAGDPAIALALAEDYPLVLEEFVRR